MAPLLSFDTPEAEQAFSRRRNMQLLRLDATWAVMWMLFQVAGVSKFDAAERKHFPWSEVAILAAWGAWLPLLLLLIRFRTDWYLRHRTALMCVLRLFRTMMVMNARLPWREAKYIGSYNAVPATAWQSYLHVYWKANLLFFGAVTFVTPMRATIPLQLASVAITLLFTAQRCRMECGLPTSSLAWPLTQASWPAVCGEGDGDAARVEGVAGTCMAAANPAAAQRYYAAVAAWIGGLLPLRGEAPPAGAASCLSLCISVHGWMQAVGGVLAPIALLWGLEERLRCREVSLAAARQQLREARQGGGAPPARSPCSPPSPLTVAALAAWLALSAWLLWLALERLVM